MLVGSNSMIDPYVLIILFLTKETSISAEFLTKVTCEAARTEIMKERDGRAIAWCVKK
jgi:hypothetical protein